MIKEKMMSLLDLNSNEKAKIVDFVSNELSHSQKLKLAAMGFAPGCEVKLVRKSLFGQTFQIVIHGASVCIDKMIAKNIKVVQL